MLDPQRCGSKCGSNVYPLKQAADCESGAKDKKRQPHKQSVQHTKFKFHLESPKNISYSLSVIEFGSSLNTSLNTDVAHPSVS